MGCGSSGSGFAGTQGSGDNGYKGGTDHQHSIGENLPRIKEKYPFRDGFFFDEGKNEGVRNCHSPNPEKAALEFYNDLAHGGLEVSYQGGGRLESRLTDGSVVSLRRVSKSDGSPAVDIGIRTSRDPRGVAPQKIHFVR